MGILFSYWWLLVPAIVLGIFAQQRVKKTYKKYSQFRTRQNITGAEVARAILDSNNLGDIPVEKIQGKLTDHYDPKSRTLRLSTGVYDGNNVAALGIAAHESGHALQHAQSYAPLALRNTVYPVANFGSNLGPILVIGGLFLGALQPLITVGILLFACAVAFTLITLPIEFNASSRAVYILRNSDFMTTDELQGAKSVLSAAALTYVASALASILTLIRLILLSESAE
jgi:Zn-dependent membrane protease YugP